MDSNTMTPRDVLCVCPHDCPDTCSIRVTVDEGRATAVRGNPDHAFTRGFLCHKVSRYLERVYHSERLTTPLRRSGRKGSGSFEPISWDEALATIADRFRRITASEDGPQSILPYSYCGTMGKIQGEGLDRRFFHRLGASLLDRTICATAGGAGYAYTTGRRYGMDPEAFGESQYIVNWGSNTAVTNVHLWVRMLEARRNGGRLVTVDPYQCRTAARSDWHVQPRVGSDAALALGMMHVIFRDGLADDEYLNEHCVGADELREHVLRHYDVDTVARQTGLDGTVIERFAHEYATTRPAAIRINYGIQRHYGGGMAVRTIACLPAVVGAWRDPAGGILLSTSGHFPLNLQALQRPDLIPAGTRTINMVQLAEALHGELPGPPVRALYVYNSNPAAVCPDLERVLDGLKREDLFTVVHDQFLTDTADYADIVLPATTQLEHADLHTAYGHTWVQWNEPAIAPVGEARSNSDVFRELARRLEFEETLFSVSDHQLAREALWETSPETPAALEGITVDRLRSEGPLPLNRRSEAPFAEGNFGGPNGKCMLYSEELASIGVSPLPVHVPPKESPEGDPVLAARFPLQLLSPPSPHFLNSTFVNVESLRRSAGEPEIHIHAEDAGTRNLNAGDIVRVFNDRGEFIARLRIDKTVRPGVVVSEGIWWQKLRDGTGNANVTTSTALTDFGGGATFFDNLVEVSACQ